MIITDELLKQYRNDPYKFDYDSGYNCASIDAWNEYSPKVFKKSHSKAWRNGYRHGWANQRAYLMAETLDIYMRMSEHVFNGMVEKELERVTAETNMLAECSDEECEEYGSDWREVIALLER